MRVMVIGASQDPAKYGHKAVRAYRRQGHTVFPVNSTLNEGETVLGLPAFRSIADVPGPIDRATIYVHPRRGGLDVARAIAARGDVAEVYLNPGAESDEVISEYRRLGIEPILACSIIEIGELP